MKGHLKIGICCSILSILFCATSFAQEVDNELQPRLSTELSYKPLKRLTLELIPEVRMDDNFALDKYLIEADLSYKVNSFFSTSILYRFVGDRNKELEIDYKNMFGAYVVFKQDVNRFKGSLRLRYSFYYDDGAVSDQTMRYKFQVKYNIKKCKITPLVLVEPFQLLTTGQLEKMRYAAGVRYKINKNNEIGCDYKFDYYMLEYTNRHIINVLFKHSF